MVSIDTMLPVLTWMSIIGLDEAFQQYTMDLHAAVNTVDSADRNQIDCC